MFECRSCFQMKPEPSSWRGNELWCSRCILVDGLDKEHDRTPPSRSAGSGRLFGQCGSCSKDVCGKAIKTKNAVFHTKCFVCAKCDQSLVGKGHVTQPDGRPFCKSCNTNATMTSANGVRYMPGKVVTYIDGLRVDHQGKVRRIHDSTGLWLWSTEILIGAAVETTISVAEEVVVTATTSRQNGCGTIKTVRTATVTRVVVVADTATAAKTDMYFWIAYQ
eukprot:498018_1